MKLRDYLEATRVRQEVFARHVGITHRTLVNALLGKEVKLTTAIRIEKATCGAVTCHDMYLEACNDKTNAKKQKTTQQNQTPLNAPIRLDNVS
jgi:plasmid maintenance system antidote protein VapI